MHINYKNPIPTVDIIIEIADPEQNLNRPDIVLINRKNPPHGWAIPGGFVDYGESLESAALREAREETSLNVDITRQFHTYSDPDRDPRQHTITTVYIAKAQGKPVGADDAIEASVFDVDHLPENIVFDHKSILKDYISHKY